MLARGLVLLFLFGSSIVFGQQNFESKNVKNLYNSLTAYGLKLRNTTVFKDTSESMTFKNLTVRINIDSGNTVSFIGYNFFPSVSGFPFCPELYRFIESKLLEFSLDKDFSVAIKKASQKKIDMKLNNATPGGFFNSFSQAINVIKNSKSFKIVKDSLTYITEWDDSTGNQFAFKFPANNILIQGMNKKELDDELSIRLRRTRSAGAIVPDVLNKTELIKQSDSTYLLKGRHYYASISSDLYYLQKDTAFNLLFSPSSPTISLSDLFLKPYLIPQNIQLNIMHIQYGANQVNFSTSLNNFMGYFQKNYEVYVGIEDTSATHLVATVVIYNRDLNFINLLAVNTTAKDLFNKNGQMNITLHSNIPSDNIKDLFGKYINTNEK